MQNEKIRYFSMFTGVGGFELGIERANNDKFHTKTQNNNERIESDTPPSNGERRRTCSNDFELGIECANNWFNSRRDKKERELSSERTDNIRQWDIKGDSSSRKSNALFECVGFSEIDKYANQLLATKFPTIRNYGDATKINPRELPDFDMLCGGFPCQSFSIAGKRRGFEDTRGTMFFEIARILEVKRPKIVFLENVKGLLNHDGGKTFRVICETLNNLGYLVNYEILNSKNFGVPQNRERVFIIGYHINAIVEDGLTEKKILLKRTILDYLFQLFLQNLKEVKKLQEHKSKDWVLGYLILKEILRNQKLSELVKTKDGLMIPTEEKIFELKEEDMWQNIESLLKIILEESCIELNKSTILTATSETIESKTYTYAELLMSILSLIVALRNSSKNLWKEMLSFLILIKENTKYARIIEKTEREIRTDNFTYYESRILQDAERVFIIGSLRGESRPEILPFGRISNEINRERNEKGCLVSAKTGVRKVNQSNTLDTMYYKGLGSNQERIAVLENPETLLDINQAQRVYSTDGQSITLKGLGGGQGAKTGLYAVPVLTTDRENKRQNGRRFKEDGEESFTLTGQDIHGVAVMDLYNNKEHTDRSPALTEPHHNTLRVRDGLKIRRLTPIECERLQGFPDNWTEGFSDTQRYKMMGNAVTVNVIKAIVEKLI